MTLYEFNALDEMEQAEAVWDGVHIGERFDEEHNILLYHIDKFYVEAFAKLYGFQPRPIEYKNGRRSPSGLLASLGR